MKTFKDYWYSLSTEQRLALVTDSGVSYPYLWCIADGRKKAGPRTIARLSSVDPRLTIQFLRPDLYSQGARV